MPIKNALLKYYDKTDVKDIDMYEYRRNKMIENYTYVLEIHKQGNRYVCSKERLEQIDFNKYETLNAVVPGLTTLTWKPQ